MCVLFVERVGGVKTMSEAAQSKYKNKTTPATGDQDNSEVTWG